MPKYVLFFLLCVGIGGMVFYFFSPHGENTKPVWTFRTQEKQIPMTYAESIASQKDILAIDTSLYNDALSSNSATGCVRISDGSMRHRCQDLIGAALAQQS